MKVKIKYGDLVSGRHRLLFGEEVKEFCDTTILADIREYAEDKYYIRDWTEVTLVMNDE